MEKVYQYQNPKGGWFYLDTALVDQYQRILPPAAFSLLIYYLRHTDGWINHKSPNSRRVITKPLAIHLIAADINMSENTVSTHNQTLEKQGLLLIGRQKKGSKVPHRYQVLKLWREENSETYPQGGNRTDESDSSTANFEVDKKLSTANFEVDGELSTANFGDTKKKGFKRNLNLKESENLKKPGTDINVSRGDREPASRAEPSRVSPSDLYRDKTPFELSQNWKDQLQRYYASEKARELALKAALPLG